MNNTPRKRGIMVRRVELQQKPEEPELTKEQIALAHLTADDLNKYFSDMFQLLPVCFELLSTSSDDLSKRVHKAFMDLVSRDGQHINFNKLDLNKIADDAKVTKGELRRLLMNALDFIYTDDAQHRFNRAKPALAGEIIDIALDRNHPDSRYERDQLAKQYGWRTVPRNAQIIQFNNNQSAIQIESRSLTFEQIVSGDMGKQDLIEAEAVEVKQLPATSSIETELDREFEKELNNA